MESESWRVPKFIHLTERERRLGEDPQYRPDFPGGPLVTYDDPFSLLHETGHAVTLDDPSGTNYVRKLEDEKSANRHVVHQMIDAGVWKPSYKKDMVSSLSSYFAPFCSDSEDPDEKARWWIGVWEKEARRMY